MKRLLTAVVVLPFLIASILISSLWWVFLLLAVAAMVLGTPWGQNVIGAMSNGAAATASRWR